MRYKVEVHDHFTPDRYFWSRSNALLYAKRFPSYSYVFEFVPGRWRLLPVNAIDYAD